LFDYLLQKPKTKNHLDLSIANQTRLAKAVKRARHFGYYFISYLFFSSNLKFNSFFFYFSFFFLKGLIPYTSKHQDFSHEYKLLSNLKNIKDGESIKDLVENQT